MKTKLLMTTLFLVLFLSLAILPLQAQVTKVWDKSFGGTNIDYLTTMIATPDGGYLLGGYSRSGVEGNKTAANQTMWEDYWVVKMNADGSKAWDRAFGGNQDDRLTSITTTADGGYVLGGYSYSGVSGSKTQASRGATDFWVVKLNASGNKVWDKTFGGSGDDMLASVTRAADGGFLLGGRSNSGAGGDKTEPARGTADYDFDYWVVKIDSNGNKSWDKTYGGTEMDYLTSIATTADGGFLLGGYSLSSTSGEKSEMWRWSSDYWVVRINSTGTKLWDKTYGGDKDDELQAVISTADGGFLIGGRSYSEASGDKTEAPKGYVHFVGEDYWIVKLNADGSKAWDRTYGGSDSDYLMALLQTPDGGYLLGGSSKSQISADKSEGRKGDHDFHYDYWIVKVTANGNKTWDKTFGGNATDRLVAMVPTADGLYLLGGVSESEAKQDKSTNNWGAEDFWVLKFSAANTLRASRQDIINSPILVYPNPSFENCKVVVQDLRPGLVQLVLYNTFGQQVVKQEIHSSELREGTILNTSSLPAGSYYLQVQIQDWVQSLKIIRL